VADRVVYSTRHPADGQRPGPPTGDPPRRRAVKRAPPSSAAQRLEPGTLYVERTRKGRAGKTVTLVQNVQGGGPACAALLKTLKTACGAGGTVKDGVLEIQGDQRDRVVAQLQAMGHRVKVRGG
jgi:translation initiation factor 1